MKTQALALPRPTKEKAKPTNIRLAPKLRFESAQNAVDRYGWSLTHLIRALLEKENSHKRGIVNAKLK